MDWKKSLVISVKEFVKVVILAMIPLIIDGLRKGHVDFESVGVAGLLAFLIALNEFLKKSDSVDYKGIMGQ